MEKLEHLCISILEFKCIRIFRNFYCNSINLCISILEFKLEYYKGNDEKTANLCISILEFKWSYEWWK